MAKPPLPLSEVLPHADIVLSGEVASVVSTDADDDPASEDSPSQVLLLDVQRVLRGAVSTAGSRGLIVKKPRAPWAARAGVKGTWLLARGGDGGLTVLGRYGPDSYRPDVVEQALKR